MACLLLFTALKILIISTMEMVCKSRGQMQNLKLNSFVVSCVFFLCLLVFFLKGHLQVNILYKSQSNTHLWFCHTQTQEAHEMAF